MAELQLAQRGARLQPQFLAKVSPQLLVEASASACRPAPVQGAHALSPEVLAQRVAADQAVELGGHAGVVAVAKLGLYPVLDRAEPGFFKPGSIGLANGKSAAPDSAGPRHRPSARRSPAAAASGRPPARSRPCPLPHQPLEGVRVELPGCQPAAGTRNSVSTAPGPAPGAAAH